MNCSIQRITHSASRHESHTRTGEQKLQQIPLIEDFQVTEFSLGPVSAEVSFQNVI